MKFTEPKPIHRLIKASGPRLRCVTTLVVSRQKKFDKREFLNLFKCYKVVFFNISNENGRINNNDVHCADFCGYEYFLSNGEKKMVAG